MRVRTIAALIFLAFALYFAIYYMIISFNAINYLLTPPSKRPSTAEIFVNSSGVFLRVPPNFGDKKMWVDGIIVTEDTWILDNPAIEQVGAPPMAKHTYGAELRSEEISKLIHMYSNRVIWVNRELSSGTYVFNVTSILDLQKGVMYPIWHGKVVIGDKEYPLTSFGHVAPINPKLLYNSTILTISIGVRNYANHPIAVGGSRIQQSFAVNALKIFRREGVQKLVEYVKTVVLPTIVKAIKNGTIRLAWSVYPPDYIPSTVVHNWLSENKLAVVVELAIDEIIANATVTRPDTGFTYYVVTYKSVSITAYTYKEKPDITYKIKEALYTEKYIPGHRVYAIIVVYRNTPYSYYKALGYIAKVDVWYPTKK